MTEVLQCCFVDGPSLYFVTSRLVDSGRGSLTVENNKIYNEVTCYSTN